MDDRVAIIGSANINDRSMLGDRDTEVCVFLIFFILCLKVALRIEDTKHSEVKFAGAPWIVGNIVHNLRVKLMRQHLGNPNAGNF